MSTTRTYDGTPTGALIESDTNPWVEVNGWVVDWSTYDGPRAECPCGDEHDAPIPGVIAPIDTAEGINRCDAAGVFPGDLDAALALARLVGGVVKFEAADPDELTSDDEMRFERRILDEGR